MENLLKMLSNIKKNEIKADIKIKISSQKKECITEVEGNLPGVLTAISVLVSNLVENGIPSELIRGAVEIGINESPKDTKTKVIKVDSKEKAEVIEKLLKELVED